MLSYKNVIKTIRNFLQKAIDLVLYGNIWIAMGALVLCLQTQYLLTGKFKVTRFSIFAFFATLLLYSIHRIISIEKLRNHPGHYDRIREFRFIYYVFTAVSGIFCILLYLKFNYWLQIILLLPAIMSFGYALPFLPKGKRLRDVNYIKIFLISLSWSLVTVVLPIVELNIYNNLSIVIMVIERFCYVFVIALCFDIRDISLDISNDVKTLPSTIGIRSVKILAYGLLLLMIVLGWFNYSLQIYTLQNWLGLCLSGIISAILVLKASEKRSDYFFFGLVDGLLLLQLPLILLLLL